MFQRLFGHHIVKQMNFKQAELGNCASSGFGIGLSYGSFRTKSYNDETATFLILLEFAKNIRLGAKG